MNSRLKSALVVFFAFTTVIAGALAWQQRRATAELTKPLENDRAALEKRLADAEHRAHDLQNELDALKARAGSAGGTDELSGTVGDDQRDRPGRRGPGGGPEAFMAMMNDPQVAQLMTSREKLMLDSRYAALFKSLTQGPGAAMSPEQLDAFKNLLVEKQNSLRDVMMTARSQGVTDRSEINQLVKNTQAEVDTQIQSALGDSGYQQYQQYEQTLPQRNLVNQLSQSLSYTSTPLTDSQSQQLIQLLAANAPSTSSNGQLRNVMGYGGGGLGGGVPITDAAITQAQGVLSPVQVQALTTIQKQQQDQQAIFQAMRAARQNPTPPAPALK